MHCSEKHEPTFRSQGLPCLRIVVCEQHLDPWIWFCADPDMVCNSLTVKRRLPTKDADALYQFLSTLFKIAVISLLVGAGLSFINITAEDVLGFVGLSPIQLWIYMLEFRDWAIPNMILGAFIVVPVWLVIYLFRPPRA